MNKDEALLILRKILERTTKLSKLSGAPPILVADISREIEALEIAIVQLQRSQDPV